MQSRRKMEKAFRMSTASRTCRDFASTGIAPIHSAYLRSHTQEVVLFVGCSTNLPLRMDPPRVLKPWHVAADEPSATDPCAIFRPAASVWGWNVFSSLPTDCMTFTVGHAENRTGQRPVSKRFCESCRMNLNAMTGGAQCPQFGATQSMHPILPRHDTL